MGDKRTNPWETGETKGNKKGNKSKIISPASTHAMGDKGRERETKQNISPASRHGVGDKGRQRAGISIVSMQELRAPHSKAV